MGELSDDYFRKTFKTGFYMINFETRQAVVEYVRNGHSFAETARTFDLSDSAVRKFYRLYEKFGLDGLNYNFNVKVEAKKKQVIDRKALLFFIKDNPNLRTRDYAKHFGCSDNYIRQILWMYGLSKEKRQNITDDFINEVVLDDTIRNAHVLERELQKAKRRVAELEALLLKQKKRVKYGTE